MGAFKIAPGRGKREKVKPSGQPNFWELGDTDAKPEGYQQLGPSTQLLVGSEICAVHGCEQNVFADLLVSFLDFLSIFVFPKSIQFYCFLSSWNVVIYSLSWSILALFLITSLRAVYLPKFI